MRLSVLVVVFVAACAGVGRETPVAVYDKVYRAMRAGDTAEIVRHMTAARAAGYKPGPPTARERELAARLPEAYEVHVIDTEPDGRTARLVGVSEIAPKLEIRFHVDFVLEGGAWKIADMKVVLPPGAFPK